MSNPQTTNKKSMGSIEIHDDGSVSGEVRLPEWLVEDMRKEPDKTTLKGGRGRVRRLDNEVALQTLATLVAVMTLLGFLEWLT